MKSNIFSLATLIRNCFDNVSKDFAALNSVKKQQVTQWKDDNFIVINGCELYSKRRDLKLPEISDVEFTDRVLALLTEAIKDGAMLFDDIKTNSRFEALRENIVALITWHQANNNAYVKHRAFSFSDIEDSRFFTATNSAGKRCHLSHWFSEKVVEVVDRSALLSEALKQPHVLYNDSPVELVCEDFVSKQYGLKAFNELSNSELLEIIQFGSKFFIDNGLASGSHYLNDIELVENNKSNRSQFPFFFKGAKRYKLMLEDGKYTGYYLHAWAVHESNAQWRKFPCS